MPSPESGRGGVRIRRATAADTVSLGALIAAGAIGPTDDGPDDPTPSVDAHRFYRRHGFAPSHVGFRRLLVPPD